MELITIIIIIVAWISIVLAPAAKLAYEDELNKTEEKRGTRRLSENDVMRRKSILHGDQILVTFMQEY